jgi:hypothetical protein
MPEPYNPLDKINLGKSVVDALLEQASIRLSSLSSFSGAGIYALYYHGPFPAYQPISRNPDGEDAIPIYAGKAVPAGARKGASLIASNSTNALWRRIAEHRDTISEIEQASANLKLDDFSVRYLAVDDIWIPLGESLLISTFNPVWNRLIDGFGNHDPGAGRYNGLRPLWDVVHPGRSWAPKCKERPESVEQIILKISEFFR